MTGISRFEKWMLILTGAFLLVCGTWFFARQDQAQPYQVTTVRQAVAEADIQPEQEEAAVSEPDSLLPGEQIDLNTAGVEELQRLPGIGEKRAQAIVAYREEQGPFETVEEIQNVSGIGEGILNQIREYSTVTTQTEGAQ